MEPLDPELGRLVAAERAEVEPTAVDRQRVARSLAARLGAGFALGVGVLSSPATAVATGSAVGLLLKLSAGVALSGGLAVFAASWAPNPEPARAPARAPSAAAVAPVVSASHPEPAKSPEPPAAPPRLEPKAKLETALKTALPPLAEEARLLKQAQQALRTGNPSQALAALTEHQRRFPRGQLGVERDAARVQALCGLNQRARAAEDAAAFLRQHPGSGLAAQVRASCGVTKPSR